MPLGEEEEEEEITRAENLAGERGSSHRLGTPALGFNPGQTSSLGWVGGLVG